MPVEATVDDTEAVVRRINATLAGPVIDVLSALVPEVAALPRGDALELILDDVDLLHRCFLAFHANLPAFRPLLRGPDGRPVDDCETPLSCGRTLDEVVAMIVRTAAKRHFRRRLDHDVRRLRHPPRGRRSRGLLRRLGGLLMIGRRSERKPSPGEALYAAVERRLRHDWQVPLLPEYCGFKPAAVVKLGDRLLDWRVPEDVRRARLSPDSLPPPTPVEVLEYLRSGVYALPPILPPPERPLTLRAAADRRPAGTMAPAPQLDAAPASVGDRRAPLDALLSADGRHLRAEAFTPVLTDPKVAALLPGAGQGLKPGAPLEVVGAEIARMVVDRLELSTEQLAVFLLAAHAALGDSHFETAFGVEGRPDYVERILERAVSAGICGESGLAAVTVFVKGLFAR